MIQVEFTRDENSNLLSFQMSGHAGYGKAGEDIVCAAASVLAIETVNNVDRLAGHQMLVEEAGDEGGYLYAEVRPDLTPEQEYITQILLKHLFLSLGDVAASYPEYIQIK